MESRRKKLKLICIHSAAAQMKSTGSTEMSRTHVAVMTVSQRIFAMSLSPKNCVTLEQSITSHSEDAEEAKVAETKIAKDSPFRNMIGKRRHSTSPAPLREKATRPRPRNAKSLTEIPNTEIIDGLFTTTLCSTELWKLISPEVQQFSFVYNLKPCSGMVES